MYSLIFSTFFFSLQIDFFYLYVFCGGDFNLQYSHISLQLFEILSWMRIQSQNLATNRLKYKRTEVNNTAVTTAQLNNIHVIYLGNIYFNKPQGLSVQH